MSLNRIRPIELPDVSDKGGTITEVSVQKKDASRCAVYLDGSYAFGLHMDLVLKAGLKKSMRLEADAARELLTEDLYFKAMKRIMDYIAYRPRGQKEIRDRLNAFKIPEELQTRIFDRLTELNYVDDERLARSFASSRWQSKGYGPRRIEQELRKRGIAPETASRVISELTQELSVGENLQRQISAAERRYRNEEDDAKRKQKMIGFLSRRGFSMSDIMDALNR